MLQAVQMPELSIIPGAELSEAHEHQIRSFVRLHWHDEYLYDIDAPLVPPERHPVHVVVAERHALLSHGRVTWVPFEHRGGTYRLYCLGDVFTYPAFRRRGLGADVVAAATGMIEEDREADLAILFCDPAHQNFYARHGWRPAPALRATVGGGEKQDGLPMVLLQSDRARALELGDDFALPGYGW